MSLDDKWRTVRCGKCRGFTVYDAWVGDYEIFDCNECSGGQQWIRPSGHLFQYPGGPACGMLGRDAYERATPYVLPPKVEDVDCE